MMSQRENFFRAMHRENPERTPFFFTMCESLVEQFARKHGTRDYFGHYGMPFRIVNVNPTKNRHDFSHYFAPGQQVDEINEWGLGLRKSGTFHFAEFISPMENFDSADQVLSFPLPDILEDYRWEGLAQQVRSLAQADLVSVSGPDAYIDIFEPAWYLRGLENLLMDMFSDDPIATACLDRMTDVKCFMARRYAQVGVDVLIYGDDVGTERAMMMSAPMWRKWLKPRLARAIRAAKDVKPDILCYYHSDGAIEEIIEDLIEIGVDILNPVQPECMDPVKIKEQYGERISFWGTIGTQTTMPFGSAQDVRNACLRMLEQVSRGGGLVLAPTHLLEPEVPFENIEMFVETVQNYKG